MVEEEEDSRGDNLICGAIEDNDDVGIGRVGAAAVVGFGETVTVDSANGFVLLLLVVREEVASGANGLLGGANGFPGAFAPTATEGSANGFIFLCVGNKQDQNHPFTKGMLARALLVANTALYIYFLLYAVVMPVLEPSNPLMYIFPTNHEPNYALKIPLFLLTCSITLVGTVLGMHFIARSIK